LYHHVKRIKSDFNDKFANMNKFIIHNIRAIRIRAVYDEEGLSAAQELAQH
jgi:hypothetical protein